MASVYERNDSRFWWACFKGPGGKWRQRSTKETSRAKALKIAFAWESVGLHPAMQNPVGAQIDKVSRSVYEQATGRVLEDTPARDYFAKWLDRVKISKAAGTLDKYEKSVRYFLDYLGEKAERPIAGITLVDVQGFADARIKAGRTAHTVKMDVSALGQVFRDCIKAGLIGINPAALVELPNMIHKTRGTFSRGDLEAILAEAKGSEWEMCVLFGAYAGLRLRDATNLKWDHIDLAAGTVTYLPMKSARGGAQKTLVVPLHGRIQERLEALASAEEVQRDTYLCPSLAGRNTGGRNGLSADFTKVMRAAGVDRSATNPDETMKSFHSLRHYFNSEMINAGVDVDLRKRLSGHATTRMNDQYSHARVETLRNAIAKLR